MPTFSELRKRSRQMVKNIVDHTGVDEAFAINVIQYARQLARKNNPDMIDELVFVAQLGLRFGITARFLVQLIFECRSQVYIF
ncbi:hypothetical protein PoB_003830600 [Plakobranchus ocellatus]|uniref:Uncharacterized protein n=1 Tax=Plakobranchus ocellatus TaxID=259542 RepID=A0AAV4AKW0_9GAST|nr:hypothetical protein PoB_003830600 [Plakobranchus ocellatus]